MPKIDPAAVPESAATGYPPPYDRDVARRFNRRLGAAAGLTDFGVTLTRLAPGGWSSQRHWHSSEDEFAVLLEGEAVLVSEAGETLMRAGDCAAFASGVADAHHFVNRSDRDALLLVVGADKPADTCHYPDIDLHLPRNDGGYTHKDGTPY